MNAIYVSSNYLQPSLNESVKVSRVSKLGPVILSSSRSLLSKFMTELGNIF